MLIGITSDTHTNGRAMLKSVEYFNSRNVSLVIHGGDWDMPFSLRFYKELKCPMKSVLGNGDPDICKFWWINEKQNINLDIQFDARFLDFVEDGKRIAVFHGDSEPLLNLLKECQLYDLVVYGHNHIAKIEKVGKTLFVNPGSLVGVHLPQFPQNPYTVAVYDTTTGEAEIVKIIE
ncbi:MAG: metallophosphoesterase [Patescibacteria group bacterium]